MKQLILALIHDDIKDLRKYKTIKIVNKNNEIIRIDKFLSLKGKQVKDNGIFVYKKMSGYKFEPKRNWGYSKYLKLMELTKKRDNETGMIAPLNKGDIIHNVVNIDVFEKSFTNDFSQFVKYNVARTIELIKKGDFPF